MQKTLDLSIKKNEIGTLSGGYTAGKTYQTYMENQAWYDFLNDMEKFHHDAYKEYGAGSGGELKSKGNTPPKMASYGSSSRMIYNLCKDIPNFHFEKKFHTRIGGISNLDGFLEKEDRDIFVEAKCREPYGMKSCLVDEKYRDLYQYINQETTSNLNIQIENIKDKMYVTFSVGNMIISSFDVKQMICHMLGIAMNRLKKFKDKKISFLYLCYNPKMIEIIDEKKREKIFATYDKMCSECNAIDFVGLWKLIIEYLQKEINISIASDIRTSQLLSQFNFTLCDQNDFNKYLK